MSTIKFISDITVKCLGVMGNDAQICSAARVSTIGEDSIIETESRGLIRYLMEHRHGTPFEHGCLRFFVHAPIFVWREWHRHRVGFSYNEESGRYKVLEPCFYIPEYSRPMIKVDGWKPGRPKFNLADEGTYDRFCARLKKGYERDYEDYLLALSDNIDPGLARDGLPVGIYSSCWVTCNPRSLMHFLSLRTYDSNAAKVSYPLYEIEVAARQCEEVLKQYFPITYAAFVAFGRVAP